jgi:hypothetical protein
MRPPSPSIQHPVKVPSPPRQPPNGPPTKPTARSPAIPPVWAPVREVFGEEKSPPVAVSRMWLRSTEEPENPVKSWPVVSSLLENYHSSDIASSPPPLSSSLQFFLPACPPTVGEGVPAVPIPLNGSPTWFEWSLLGTRQTLLEMEHCLSLSCLCPRAVDEAVLAQSLSVPASFCPCPCPVDDRLPHRHHQQLLERHVVTLSSTSSVPFLLLLLLLLLDFSQQALATAGSNSRYEFSEPQ